MADSSGVRQPPLREAELLGRIRSGGPSVVALSGGVDSATVTALAVRALGGDVLAVTLRGPAVAREEVERARAVAESVGVRHEVVTVDPLREAGYRSNPSNRCYFCRTVESRAILDATAGRGFGAFLDGIQWDDLGDDRPGIRAMDEAGFQHPLLDARWGKVEVRTFARSAGLPNWDAPSEACLASRIRHGQEVTRPLLGRIESAERSVRALGFLRVRVRVDGGAARVEVDPPEVDRLRSEPTSSRVVAELLGLGFTGVSLDPSGYRGAAGA